MNESYLDGCVMMWNDDYQCKNGIHVSIESGCSKATEIELQENGYGRVAE